MKESFIVISGEEPKGFLESIYDREFWKVYEKLSRVEGLCDLTKTSMEEDFEKLM